MPPAAPRVSVLLPCRDAAVHLPEAMASIRAQTFHDFEVLAVDDGSSDATFGLLRAWAVDDPRVRVLATHGRGLVPALASGLAAARGSLIARMDADDVAEPNRLVEQVSLLDRETSLAACGTGVEYFPPEMVRDGTRRYQDWLNSIATPDEISRDVFIECPIAHPTLMIRRSVILAVGGYRELGWPEDYDLILRVWAAGYRMARVPAILHHWREGPDRLSRTDERYDLDAFLRLKVFFLTRTLLAGGRSAVIWGAGPVGKRLARALIDAGTPIRAFVDLDPNKVGQEIHGATVASPDDLARLVPPRDADDEGARTRPWRGFDPDRPLVLAAVAQEGARESIRGECRRQGLTEGADFIAVA